VEVREDCLKDSKHGNTPADGKKNRTPTLVILIDCILIV
jgi:hypothetical protein